MTSIIESKDLSKIINEWDEIASIREEQISSGKDHSANEVLAPAILKLIPKHGDLIDIGCGTGWLTAYVAPLIRNATGIDPSEVSIKIALDRYKRKGVSYLVTTIEDFAKQGITFDVAISNMSASNTPDLDKYIESSRKVLKKNGTLIMTIPHPFFWSIYWQYSEDKNFNYEKTCIIESKFRIQDESTDYMTTHFHHPLQEYVDTIESQGFKIEYLEELKGKGFNHPRFLLIKASAI